MSTHNAIKLLFLLGITLSISLPAADAATIRLVKGCTLSDAIRAANQDRRVGKCRAGSRGTDRIEGFGFRNPTQQYPAIRSPILITTPPQRQDGIIRTLQFGLGPTIPPKLFDVDPGGRLTFYGRVVINSAVHVRGHLILENGAWISQQNSAAQGPTACAIAGLPGSFINVNNATVDARTGCGIGLNDSWLFASRLQFTANNAPFNKPDFGIRAVDSKVTVQQSTFTDAEVGISATGTSVVSLEDNTYIRVERPVVAGNGAVVTDPSEPVPAAPGLLPQPDADAPDGLQTPDDAQAPEPVPDDGTTAPPPPPSQEPIAPEDPTAPPVQQPGQPIDEGGFGSEPVQAPGPPTEPEPTPTEGGETAPEPEPTLIDEGGLPAAPYEP